MNLTSHDKWSPSSSNELRALTLRRPWEVTFIAPDAELGAAGRKNIENRSWPPPARFVGQHIVLHAGKGWDDSGCDFITSLGMRKQYLVDASVPSRLVAVVKIVDKWEKGTLRVAGGFPYDSPWAFGPWCWWIADVQVLRTPVPCKGMQGLWRVPDAEAKLVRSQVVTP